jgi:hypothetical protein
MFLDDGNENDDENAYQMNKRQGGNNMIDQQSKCEITCIQTQRHPPSGKGKTVKEAAKACRSVCNPTGKKHGGKKHAGQKSPKRSLMNLRGNAGMDDSSSDDLQRRELYEFLKEQLQEENEK